MPPRTDRRIGLLHSEVFDEPLMPIELLDPEMFGHERRDDGLNPDAGPSLARPLERWCGVGGEISSCVPDGRLSGRVRGPRPESGPWHDRRGVVDEVPRPSAPA